MFKNQITKIADILIKNGVAEIEYKEIIVYGLTFGIELILNILTTIILGFMFGMVIESLIFLISFSLIRTYAGGYHSQSALKCYFFSSIVVILVLFAVKYTPINYISFISIIILLISIPIILKFSPVETNSKPLDNHERRYFRKRMLLNLVIELSIIGVLYLFRLYTLQYIISLGIMVSAILVLLGYKYLKLF